MKYSLYDSPLYFEDIQSLIGFLFYLDNNMQSGCLIPDSPILSLFNIVPTVISLILISYGLIFNGTRMITILLLIELTFWILKLFIKGGYHIGYAASFSPIIAGFDLIALFLRLKLILSIMGKRLHPIVICLIAFSIIFIKILL